MKSSPIPYEFVTGEKITIDYMNRCNKLEQLFPKHFREPTVKEFRGNRQKITEKLLEYNKKINCPKPVIRNIESILQPKTYTVTTGQQPGLFSGPIYTIYKALSAVILCKKLSNHDYSFVPLFWNASEDHDFSEVNCITMFRQNEPTKICYNSELRGRAMSHTKTDSSQLKKMVSEIAKSSPDSEFKSLLLRKIDETVEESSTIGEFFSRLMTHLLGNLGLIVIEPHCLRELMTPIFKKLIKEPIECTRILGKTNSKIEKLGYSPKIHKKPNICNFFILNDKGERMQVTHDGEFQIGNNSFSQKQLLLLLDQDPSKFSANAITRPITQDYLFPTFAYVAGPNEIAYYAQLKEIYDFFSLEMPIIFPRFGATIVESKVSKVLRKFNVAIHEFRNPEKLLKTLARKEIQDTFNSFENEISKGLNEITQEAKSIDENLIGPCKLAQGKILKIINNLENKIASNIKRQNLVSRQQVMKVHNNIFPYGDLQERQINVLEYLIKYGEKFLETVHAHFLKADYGAHLVIRC